MTLREKLKWNGNIAFHQQTVEKTQAEIASGRAQECTYYWFVGESTLYAIETYLDGITNASQDKAHLVVQAALQFFYGDWRNHLKTHKGESGHEAWRSVCLWYEQLMESLPFAAALSDWNAVARIAAYPTNDKLPEPDKAIGEPAWGWSLITFLRNEPCGKVEGFLKKAEDDRAKRPKMLCPVLRALMINDSVQFEKTLLAYLAYYRKSEFKNELMKLVALDGTMLYHLGRKQGFNVKLPENVADHVIRLD